MSHAGIAHYFQSIFDLDRSTAFTSPDEGLPDVAVTREALREGGFVKVEPGDYLHV